MKEKVKKNEKQKRVWSEIYENGFLISKNSSQLLQIGMVFLLSRAFSQSYYKKTKKKNVDKSFSKTADKFSL